MYVLLRHANSVLEKFVDKSNICALQEVKLFVPGFAGMLINLFDIIFDRRQADKWQTDDRQTDNIVDVGALPQHHLRSVINRLLSIRNRYRL
jgi:hypothetical protein